MMARSIMPNIEYYPSNLKPYTLVSMSFLTLDQQRVFLAYKELFQCQKAQFRKKKNKVRELVLYYNQPSTALIRNLGLEKAVAVLKGHVECEVSSTELKVKLAFPLLFEASAAQQTQHRVPEAGTTEVETRTLDEGRHFNNDGTSLPKVVKDGVLVWLQENQWDCPEAIEPNKQIPSTRKERINKLPEDILGNKDKLYPIEATRPVTFLRTSAAHRGRISSKRLEGFMNGAIDFATTFRDISRESQLINLEAELKTVIRSLEPHKNFSKTQLRDELGETPSKFDGEKESLAKALQCGHLPPKLVEAQRDEARREPNVSTLPETWQKKSLLEVSGLGDPVPEEEEPGEACLKDTGMIESTLMNEIISDTDELFDK
ncbi:hypothetical protein FQN49_000308 [Arthroderma sp. PD_2]|nr:hypothetical protein FQN49_000308 [Arthroderma sp. PD_2]